MAEKKENLFANGLLLDGWHGRWYPIDHTEVSGHMFFLMKHELFDDESSIIVDEHGEPVLTRNTEGFDEHTFELLKQEIMPVGNMPDPGISVKEMKAYGYYWGGMLPLQEKAATNLFHLNFDLYRLYPNDTEGLVGSMEEIVEHARTGGIFGIEKTYWLPKSDEHDEIIPAHLYERVDNKTFRDMCVAADFVRVFGYPDYMEDKFSIVKEVRNLTFFCENDEELRHRLEEKYDSITDPKYRKRFKAYCRSFGVELKGTED